MKKFALLLVVLVMTLFACQKETDIQPQNTPNQELEYLQGNHENLTNRNQSHLLLQVDLGLENYSPNLLEEVSSFHFTIAGNKKLGSYNYKVILSLEDRQALAEVGGGGPQAMIIPCTPVYLGNYLIGWMCNGIFITSDIMPFGFDSGGNGNPGLSNIALYGPVQVWLNNGSIEMKDGSTVNINSATISLQD